MKEFIFRTVIEQRICVKADNLEEAKRKLGEWSFHGHDDVDYTEHRSTQVVDERISDRI